MPYNLNPAAVCLHKNSFFAMRHFSSLVSLFLCAELERALTNCSKVDFSDFSGEAVGLRDEGTELLERICYLKLFKNARN